MSDWARCIRYSLWLQSPASGEITVCGCEADFMRHDSRPVYAHQQSHKIRHALRESSVTFHDLAADLFLPL